MYSTNEIIIIAIIANNFPVNIANDDSNLRVFLENLFDDPNIRNIRVEATFRKRKMASGRLTLEAMWICVASFVEDLKNGFLVDSSISGPRFSFFE